MFTSFGQGTKLEQKHELWGTMQEPKICTRVNQNTWQSICPNHVDSSFFNVSVVTDRVLNLSWSNYYTQIDIDFTIPLPHTDVSCQKTRCDASFYWHSSFLKSMELNFCPKTSPSMFSG